MKIIKNTSFIAGAALLVLSQASIAQVVPNGQTLPAATTQSLFPLPAAYSGTFSPNTIRSWTPRKPLQFPENVRDSGLTTAEVTLSSQYLDGLGRPVQTVEKAMGSNGKDYVFPQLYDRMGRESIFYMPYVASNSTGGFKQNPFTDQKNALGAYYNPTSNANGEKFFYEQAVYETAPMGRKTKNFPTGNSWVGSNRGTVVSYEVNAANEVRIWSIADAALSIPLSSAFYPAGQLKKMVTTDEEGKLMVDYMDKLGNIVLKKTQLTSSVTTSHDGWLCTYYIFDNYNNLRFVIPPKATKLLSTLSWTFTGNTAIANNLCFQLGYDFRNRPIIRKEPGVGPTQMVYDALDRPIMLQDSVLTQQGKWLVTQYDEQNREKRTYLWTNSNDRNYHAGLADSSVSYPTLSGTYELLTEQYYDNYTWVASSGSGLPSTFASTETAAGFISPSNLVAPFAQPVAAIYNVKGTLTGTKEKILGTSQYLYSVCFYDKKGRLIQVHKTNITGGKDITTTQYSFDGRTLATRDNQNATAYYPLNTIVLTKVTYDAQGKISQVSKKVNNDSTVLISRLTYSDLGQLKQRKIGQKKDGTLYSMDAVETLDYSYTSRNWLSSINADFVNDPAVTKQFGMQLSYDFGFSVPGNGNFSGNISGQRWRSTGDKELRAYGHVYDPVKRLIKADFTQNNGSWSNTAGIDYSIKLGDGSDPTTAYDENGNILRMDQKGWKATGSAGIDSLLYTYNTQSNQLLNVLDRQNDTTSQLGDFKTSRTYMLALSNNKTTASIDYAFDVNGNLIKDRNKDIGDATNTGITYNHLNLPVQVSFRNGGGVAYATITYTYSASGIKLKKVIQETGKPTKTYTYLGNSIYLNDTLQTMAQEEGQIRFDTTSVAGQSKFTYEYFLKDHLANTRMVLSEKTTNDPYPALSFEGSTGTTETGNQNAYWENKNGLSIDIINSRIAKPAGFGTTGTNGNYAVLARKSTGAIGAAKLLKVMAGDKVHTSVQYYYNVANANNTPASGINSFVTGFVNALNTSSIVPGGVKGASAAIGSNLQTNTALSTLLNTPANTSGSNQAPKAYLNVLFFDERFKFDNTNSIVVPVAYTPNTAGTIDRTFANALQVKKSGYVYLYISNESDEMVYFDNFLLTHEHGRILEETNYYPYGLTMLGISSKAFGKKDNTYLFNGKELEKKELSSGLGLDLYDYGHRRYDVQLGRWGSIDPLSLKYTSISPYAFVGNNPTNNIDPDGREWVNVNGQTLWDDRVLNNETAILLYGENAKYRAPGFTYMSDEGEIVLGHHREYSKAGQCLVALDATPDAVGDAIMKGGWKTFLNYFEALGEEYFFNAARKGNDGNARGIMATITANYPSVEDAMLLSMLTHNWVDRGGWSESKNQLEHYIGMFLVAERYGKSAAITIGNSNEIRGLLVNDRQAGNMWRALGGARGTAFEVADLLNNKMGLILWDKYHGNTSFHFNELYLHDYLDNAGY